MGHGPEGLPAGHGKVICMGDCARRYAKEHGLPIATGCPPKPRDVAALFWQRGAGQRMTGPSFLLISKLVGTGSGDVSLKDAIVNGVDNSV